MGTSRIRPPAVAGTFYPAQPERLESAVRSYLRLAADRAGTRAEAPSPKALIVPHAGFVYSGPIAASAYLRVEGLVGRIERVVLLGPSHRLFLRGLAVPEDRVFTTPLGEIELDAEAIEASLALPQVCILEAAHAEEHSLEVQLPFLQCALGEFSLVPFSVGEATPSEVAEVLELLWGGDETLIVISSDLSHYYDYETARRMDARTTRAIEELRPEALGPESACGRVPVRGLLEAARRHGLRAETLDLRNSGDTAGSHDQVVGYGAWALA